MSSAAIRPRPLGIEPGAIIRYGSRFSRFPYPGSEQRSGYELQASALGHSVVALRDLSLTKPDLSQTLSPIISFLHGMHGNPDQYDEVYSSSTIGGLSRAVGYQKKGDKNSPVLYMRYEDSADINKGPVLSSFAAVDGYDVVSFGFLPASEVNELMYDAKGGKLVTLKRPNVHKPIIKAGESDYSPTFKGSENLTETTFATEDFDALVALIPGSVFTVKAGSPQLQPRVRQGHTDLPYIGRK